MAIVRQIVWLFVILAVLFFSVMDSPSKDPFSRSMPPGGIVLNLIAVVALMKLYDIDRAVRSLIEKPKAVSETEGQKTVARQAGEAVRKVVAAKRD